MSSSVSDKHAMRRRLPMKLSAVVERDLGDSRFLVSMSDNIASLELFQRNLDDEFASSRDDSKKVELDEVSFFD